MLALLWEAAAVYSLTRSLPLSPSPAAEAL